MCEPSLSHARPIQNPTQIMIADMKMTVRSMASHRGTRVVGLVMVCTLLHSFERESAQSAYDLSYRYDHCSAAGATPGGFLCLCPGPSHAPAVCWTFVRRDMQK